MTAQAPSNPFPGLLPFERSQKEVFFGRRRPTNELVARLADHAFVAVVGASGSGKSSLVRCGVLSDVRSGFVRDARLGWRVAIMQPGRAAIQALAAALARPEVFGAQNGHDPRLRTRVFETVLRETPDGAGLVEIARSRLTPDENLLVVVDQFEELFRFREAIDAEELEAHAFVDILLRAREHTEERLRRARTSEPESEDGTLPPDPEPRIYVMLTMRAEFLGDCMLFRGLPEAINDSIFLVPHMNEDEKREVIERPVVSRGVKIAPELVDTILNDLAKSSLDQLPVLQHALMRTWNEWADRIRKQKKIEREGAEPQLSGPIDLRDYEAIGGIAALDRHASEAYLQLDEEQRRIAKRMFQCLTRVDDQGRRLRRPVQMNEICAVAEADEAAVIEVVQQFRQPGREFLTLRDPDEPDAEHRLSDPNMETLVDISHESLIRKWVGEWEGMEESGLAGEGLEKWVGEEARSAKSYEMLTRAVEDNDGKVGLLGRNFMDTRFRATRDWMRSEHPDPEWAARYEQPSDDGTERFGFSEAKRFYNKALAMWGLRWLLAAGLVAIIICFFVLKAQVAERVQATAYAASAGDPLLAAAILGELEDAPWLTSVSGRREPERGSAVAWRIILAGIPRASWNANADHAVFSPDGQSLLTVSDNGSVVRWDASGSPIAGEPSLIWPGDGTKPVNVAYVTDQDSSANVVAIAGFFDDGRVRRWSPDGNQLIDSVATGSINRQSNGFSPDGSILTLVGSDNDVTLWTSGTVEPDTVVQAGNAVSTGYAFSGDGATLATISNYSTGECRLRRFVRDSTGAWGIADTLTVEDCQANRETGLAVDASGGSIAFGETNGVTRLFNIGDPEEKILVLVGHAGEVMDVAFGPDSRLVTASKDRTARIWNVDNGEALAVLTGHEAAVRQAKFDSAGTLVLTTSDDGTARTWTCKTKRDCTGDTAHVLRGHVGRVEAHFSPDGAGIVTIGEEGGMRVWSVNGTLWGDSTTLAEPVTRLALSPGSDRLVVAAGGTAVVGRIPSGREASVPDSVLRYEAKVKAVAANHAAGRILVAVADSVFIYDRDWNRTELAVDSTQVRTGVAAFSPDGDRVVAGANDGFGYVWTLDTGQKEKLQHSDRVTAVAFVDESTILTGSADGVATVWTRAAAAAGGGGFEKSHVLPGGGSDRVADISTVARDGLNNGAIAIAKGDTAWVFLSSAAPVARTRVYHGHLGRVALSPDASRLATADESGRIRLWDLDRPDSLQVESLVEWTGHRGKVLDLQFSDDGGTLFSAGESETAVRAWPVEWPGLVADVREAAVRAQATEALIPTEQQP